MSIKISLKKPIEKVVSTNDEIVYWLNTAAKGDPKSLNDAIKDIAAKTGIDEQRLIADCVTLRRVNKLTSSQSPTATVAELVLREMLGGGCFVWHAPDGTLSEFIDSHWDEIPKTRLRQLVSDALLENPNLAPNHDNTFINDVVEHVLVSTLRPEPLQDLTSYERGLIVNAKNGEVWLKGTSHELRPHRPWSRQMRVTDVDYDPGATCAVFDKAMDDIFSQSKEPSAMVSHVLELLAYAFQPDRRIPTFWLFYGKGANGKSMLLELLQRMIGLDAVLSESIAKFQRDNFHTASLIGKRVLIDDDIDEDLVLNGGLIKKLSEGKLMSGRNPYGRRKRNFKSVAIPIMAGNHFPTTADVSHGMKRRTYVVPFTRIFEKTEQKLGLIDQVMAERSGVLNRFLEAYLRLVNREYRFDEPTECDEARQLFFEESHPLRDFIKHRCENAPGQKIRVAIFRKAAIQYVEEVGASVVGLGNKLRANLETLGYTITRINGLPYLVGLRIKEGGS